MNQSNISVCCMIAIVEGRGMARGEIGLASIDLRSPTLNLSQFSDTQTYVQTMTKLHRCQPIEVLTVCMDDSNAVIIPYLQIVHPFDEY